ncbi:MAG: N-acetyltransferase [Pirellulales bacterium]
MNVIIRPEAPLDLRRIWTVNQSAFASDSEANLVNELRDSGYVELSLVAEFDGEIVGHILFSRVIVATNQGSLKTLSLAPLAVSPSHQRQEIGSKLVQTGVSLCSQRGYQLILVLGHPDFYPRFGFSAELARCIEPPFGGGESWMALELAPGVLDGVEGRVEFSPPFMKLE